jgi:DNA-binding PadR family transcriptional regulator
MREPTYYILVALLDGPLHGYGVMKRVERLSHGRVRLAAGTLYAALDRLADAELVDGDRQEIVQGRARRYYRLTDHGRQALQAEAARMAQAAQLVIRRRRRPSITPELT